MRIKRYHSDYDCLVDLKKLNIRYSLNSNYIFLSDCEYRKIVNQLAEYIDFDMYVKAKGISGTSKATLKRKIEEEDGFIDIPEARIMQKKIISPQMKELIDLSVKEAGYMSAYAVKKDYGISQATLTKCVLNGKINEKNGAYCRADLEREIENDKKMISFDEVVRKVEKYYSLTIIKSSYDKLLKEIVRKGYWGQQYKLKELMCCPEKDKSGSYYFEPNIPFNNILEILRNNPECVNINCSSFFWNFISETEEKILNKRYGIERNKGIPVDNELIVKMVFILVREKKDATQLTDGDVNLITRSKSQKLQKEIRKFFSCMAETIPDTKYVNKLREMPTVTEKKDIPPYPLEVYLKLGNLIFDDKEFEKRKTVAINNSACAQILFFFSMMYCAAWRTEDICRLCAPYIEDIDEVIRNINNGTIENSKLVSIYTNFEIQVEVMNANKNGEKLEIYHVDDFATQYGSIIAIAEYWRIKDGRLTLCNNSKSVNNCIQLFGNDYLDIFGRKFVSERRLNKDYLVIQVNSILGKNNIGLRSLPEILAAVIRAHKLDLKNGQKTIFSYISHSSEGLSVDEVLYNLFEIGTMGHYKEMLGEIMYPGLKGLRLDDKATLISSLKINPIGIEKIIQEILVVQKQLKVSEHGIYESYEAIIQNIRNSFGNSSNANESNVYCMFTEITGYRKPDCIGSQYCCSENGELCPYGIYYREYVFNLVERMIVFENMEKQYTESQNTAGYYREQIRRNEIIRCRNAIGFLSTAIEKFLESVSFDKNVETFLINIITGVNKWSADII